jgi:hypothetical protein
MTAATFRCKHPRWPANNAHGQCKFCMRTRKMGVVAEQRQKRINAGLPATGKFAAWAAAL